MNSPTHCCRRDFVRALTLLAVGPAAGTWLSACRSGTTIPVPPAIAFDRDVCDWCRMTIDDVRLAAAFVPHAGRPYKFGEPGCLLSWLAEQKAARGVAFVVAQEDGTWLEATAARYARGVVRTPMRFNLAAWRGAAPSADVSWDQLLRQGKPNAQPS